jgi:hypothetical protein
MSASEARTGKSPVLGASINTPPDAWTARAGGVPVGTRSVATHDGRIPRMRYRRMRRAGSSGGDRQHVQSPYCSDPCWHGHGHAKDARVYEPGDTRAWAGDTTNAIWERGRGRLKEVHVTPRGVGALRVNIKIGDPLRNVFERQRRGTARGGGRGTAPGPVCPGAHTAPISDQRRSLSGVLDNACLTEARLRRRRWK